MRRLVIDSFAGGGGASTGIEAAIGRPVDYAINHDRLAIGMHEANHPKTVHLQNDIWKVRPHDVTRGLPVALAWFSPDCTHHSKARGGKPVEKGIRDLAWVIVDWAKAVRPDVIMLENVEEFRQWGPLDAENRPIKDRKGETFGEFVTALRDLGYEVQWRELRACDYGAPTIRKRLFMVARCDGRPIVWPAPTHGPKGGLLPRYRTAAECIDWWRPCPSIFERRRPLVEATMRRIASGIRRYVFEAEQPFIVRTGHYSHRSGEGFGFRGQGANEPLSTVTGINDYGIVVPFLGGITHSRGGDSFHAPVDEPQRTITASKGGEEALIAANLVNLTHHGGDRVESVEEPFATITAAHRGEKALVAATIVRNNHDGQGKPADSLEDPLATVTTQHNKHALVTAFLAKHFGGMVGVPVETPMPTVLSKGAQTQVVTSNLVKLYGTSSGAPSDGPMPTVTGQGNHVAEVRALLVGYYGNERDGQPVNMPVRTVTAKERYALAIVELGGELWQIQDIGMRMLEPRELYRAQGFPEGYVIDPVVDGRRLSKTDQVRMCGNSVCPCMAEALVAANVGRVGQQDLWRGYELASAAGGA